MKRYMMGAGAGIGLYIAAGTYNKDPVVEHLELLLARESELKASISDLVHEIDALEQRREKAQGPQWYEAGGFNWMTLARIDLEDGITCISSTSARSDHRSASMNCVVLPRKETP